MDGEDQDDGPVVFAVPDELMPLTRDLIALATDPGPRPLEPSEVSSELLDTAGLIASLMGSTDGSFPMLEAFFAILGLPIDAPFAL